MRHIFNDVFLYAFMLFWTHLIIGLSFLLLFFGRAENKILFLVVGLIASVFPDIDSSTSKMGRSFFSRVIVAFSKHRGIFHSFTFMLFVYFVFREFVSVLAFPFLLGYFVHLISDCFTKRGLRLFWPFKWRFRGFVKSGGMFEVFIFILFLILDVALIAGLIL
jgi:inner membrane protein